MVEPPEKLLVREKSEKFIGSLKEEMLENPTRDVQPLLCIVRLKPDEEFDEKLKQGYMRQLVATIQGRPFSSCYGKIVNSRRRKSEEESL